MAGMLTLAAAALASSVAAEAAANYTRLPGFFCHPDVTDPRLHRNWTGGLAGCIAICDADP